MTYLFEIENDKPDTHPLRPQRISAHADDEEAAARKLFRWMSNERLYRGLLEGLDVELFVDHILSHGSIQYSSGLSVELIEIHTGIV